MRKMIGFIGDFYKNKEILSTLEMLNGNNRFFLKCANEDSIFYIKDNHDIGSMKIEDMDKNYFSIFTVELFNDIYKFKVNDHVTIDNSKHKKCGIDNGDEPMNGIIENMFWNGETVICTIRINMNHGNSMRINREMNELSFYKKSLTSLKEEYVKFIGLEAKFKNAVMKYFSENMQKHSCIITNMSFLENEVYVNYSVHTNNETVNCNVDIKIEDLMKYI